MKRLVFYLLLVFIVLSTSGQSLEYARQIVQKLSSPELAGRGYVDHGNANAAKYIKGQYTEIGLKPFDKDFYQSFKIDVNTFPSAMKLQIDGVELIPGEEYIADPVSPSLSGEYAVYVVKKQDLLDDNQLRKAIKLSAGKVLIIDECDFKTDDKDKAQKATDLVTSLKYSPQIPTVATIVHSAEKLSWNNATLQGSKPAFTIKKELDLENIKKVKIDVKAKMVNYKTQNIIGYVKGTEQPDSFLVVTAHYDHLGKMGDKTYFPGANDNASGVAMLLTLAKYFAADPPRYSIAFMALSAEEIGIVGAKYYVEHPFFDLNKIKFLVNFDLAGTGDEGIKVVNGSVHKDKFEILTRINGEKNCMTSVQSRGAACNSDHCPFHEKGVPCFYIYTLGGIQAYHDVYDRYETLPLTAFTGYSQLMIEFFGNIK